VLEDSFGPFAVSLTSRNHSLKQRFSALISARIKSGCASLRPLNSQQVKEDVRSREALAVPFALRRGIPSARGLVVVPMPTGKYGHLLHTHPPETDNPHLSDRLCLRAAAAALLTRESLCWLAADSAGIACFASEPNAPKARAAASATAPSESSRALISAGTTTTGQT
jgi:hypothetical protein